MKIPRRISLINEAAGSLRDAIRAGEFQGNLPGVRALSRDLHVSIPTILGAIRVLQDEGLLRSEPGKKTVILTPPDGRLRQKDRQRHVVLLTFASNWLAGSLYYQSVMNELIELGLHVQLFEYGVKSQVLQWENLEKLVAQQQADCWVLLGAPAKVQMFFAERQLPCLLNGIAVEGVNLPDFQVDYPSLYRHAIHHLQNRGHRRICLITPEHSARVINPASIDIFRETVMERLPELPGWEPIRIYDGSTEHFRAILRGAFGGGTPSPTALVIVTVKYMASAMTWLMKHGLRIPEDVSIISRDHDDVLECLNPLPSHYRQPASASKRFVRSILAVIEKKHIRSHTRIMTEFVAGETVAVAAG